MTSAARSRFSSTHLAQWSRLCAHKSVTFGAMLRKAVATAWALRRSFPMYRIFMQSDEVAERCVNSLSARWQCHYSERFRRPPIPRFARQRTVGSASRSKAHLTNPVSSDAN